MDWKTVLQSPFFTVALPIVITLIVGIVVQNKRIDDLKADMNRQFDAVNHRLDKIESKLETHSERIAKLKGPSLARQLRSLSQRLPRRHHASHRNPHELRAQALAPAPPPDRLQPTFPPLAP